jgi:riboflavin synthase
MFTGLVEATGEIAEATPIARGVRLRIDTPLAAELTPGESLAVNGVCLTVVQAGAHDVYAEVGPETMQVTTLGSLAAGACVNLERPMRADGRLGGHFVQGHVDAVGRIDALRQDAEFHWLTVTFPAHLAKYFVHRGSIAVDGISLTVAGLNGHRFDVQLVPFTMEHTNLKRARAHDAVNLECDIIGKYIARAMDLARDGQQ